MILTPFMAVTDLFFLWARFHLRYGLLYTLSSVPVIDPLDSYLGQLTRRVERRCLVGGKREHIWVAPVASV
jgi:hypothetical protein